MKPKFTVNYNEGMGKYVFCSSHLGLDGEIDTDKKEVRFDYNIANNDFFEGNSDPRDVIDSLEELARGYNKLADLIRELHKGEGENFLHQIEFDDYPSDGDSLLRITIKFEHPAFAKIKNKLYDME